MATPPVDARRHENCRRAPRAVLDPGRLNTDAGPDFFNAKVIIDGQKWAGDIEIHVRASDWHRHRHDHDPAYRSVILHVVARDDAAIQRPDGQTIPQMRMECDPGFHHSYTALVGHSASSSLPCASEIRSIENIHLHGWLDRLAFERLHAKADRIERLLRRTNGDWEEACFITLARALGFGVNSDPLERLAASIPPGRHRQAQRFAAVNRGYAPGAGRPDSTSRHVIIRQIRLPAETRI